MRDPIISKRRSGSGATVIINVLTMLAVYPFVQKYLVKGILLGGVKE